MSVHRVSVWVGEGRRRGKSEEWPCAGLRRIEGPFWVDSSPCLRILITKLWGSLLLLCFFSWGPSAQELAQSQVVLAKILLIWCVTTIFPDWKPIASSREPSYIDYFGLDQSQGSFEGKTPEIESLAGKLSSSTDSYSRQERVLPRSPQALNTWPGTQPRRWDKTKNVCKELLCGPGGPIMTTISWWGGVGESPMRRWKRW